MTPLDRHDDGVIRELFAELRGADRPQVPDFRRMRELASAPRPIAAALTHSFVRAAAAVVFLTAGLMVLQRLHRTRTSRSAPVSALASWKSPTAILLRTPGRELLQEVPDLHSSILDRITLTNKSKESGI
jgi:hypothetical protein